MKMLGQKCKVKWLDHHNGSWVTEDCESTTYGEDLNALYCRLVDNKELMNFPPQTIKIGGPALADFDAADSSSSAEEQEHFLDNLHASQLQLASVVYNNTPFALKLKKQQWVLQRIYYAISHKFHIHRDVGSNMMTTASNRTGFMATNRDRQGLQASAPSGNDALIELGVKTGLSLLFSLFRQNWFLSQQLGQVSFTNEILQNAITILNSLPPLSLANENRLASLSTDALNEVTQFLR